LLLLLSAQCLAAQALLFATVAVTASDQFFSFDYIGPMSGTLGKPSRLVSGTPQSDFLSSFPQSSNREEVRCHGRNSLRFFDCPPQLFTDGLCTSADVRKKHACWGQTLRSGHYINFLAPKLLTGGYHHDPLIHSLGTGQMFTHFSKALHELLAARFRGFPDI
jgi:hypothetical protein